MLISLPTVTFIFKSIFVIIDKYIIFNIELDICEWILLHSTWESFEFEKWRLIPIYLRNAVMVHSSLLAFLNGITNSNELRSALEKVWASYFMVIEHSQYYFLF